MTDNARETEYKSFVTANFNELMNEVDYSLKAGWAIDPSREPSHNFYLYEVYLIRNDETIAKAKSLLQIVLDGKTELTKEKRVEIMGNARKVRMDKIAAKKAAEAEE